MKGLLVIICGFLASISVYSQQRDTLKSDHFWCIYSHDSINHGAFIGGITIIDYETAKEVQKIAIDTFIYPKWLDKENIVFLKDVNFDGYLDLAVIRWHSTTSDREYNFWIFDHNKKQFAHDTALSNLMNPCFFTEKKLVHTSWRIGQNEFGHAIYSWQDSVLVLNTQQLETWGIAQNRPGVLTTTKIINGLVKTETKELTQRVLQNHCECGLTRQ